MSSQIILAVVVLGGLGTLFGLVLGYVGERLKVIEDEKLVSLKNILPGANCGGCGRPGCSAFAEDLFIGKADTDGCPVGGYDLNVAISEILGVATSAAVQRVAFVACGGADTHVRKAFDYQGLNDCKATVRLPGGSFKACAAGCLGGGDCVRACVFGAITVADGAAVVDSGKCTGCTACVDACPKSIIQMLPKKNTVYVACSARASREEVRAACSAGCIVCGLCIRRCKFDCIKLANFLPVIDYDKCTNCGVCANVCPVKCIANLRKKE